MKNLFLKNNIALENNEIKIEGALTQETVVRILEKSEALFKKNAAEMSSTPILNLSAVTLFDSASLAFLIALLRQAKKYQITLKFTHVPQQMQDIAKVVGLTAFLPIIE